MTRSTSRLFAWGLSLVMVAIAAWFGRDVSFEEQWPLYEALRTTAAIIFAVVGAWLAIVYPDRLRLSLGSEPAEARPANQRFNDLFTPIANSTIILCIVLFIGVLAPILRQVPFLVEHAGWARTFSFMLLMALTLWQLFTVVLTLVPADALKSQADQESARRAYISSLRGLGSAQSPPNEGDT